MVLSAADQLSLGLQELELADNGLGRGGGELLPGGDHVPERAQRVGLRAGLLVEEEAGRASARAVTREGKGWLIVCAQSKSWLGLDCGPTVRLV